MAKSGASKGAKKINAFNDGKLDGVNVAQNISGMPDHVYESIKRQYKAGTPNEDPNDPYTKADADLIRKHFKNKKGKV